MPDTPSIRRMNDSELPRVLDTLASSGGTRRTPDSWRQDHMTALLLAGKDAMGPVMPIARRPVQVSPGRTLNAGWVSSNQFAAGMSVRRHSRQTVPQWANLLPEIDALLVVRREDNGLIANVGRWYTRVGFHEVLAIRCLYLDMHEAPATAANRYTMQVITPAEVGRWSGQMAGVHREVFGNYGGVVTRSAMFWSPALAHHFYREHYQFQIIGLWSGETLVGYAVVGWSGWHSKRPRMDILELATRQWDTSVAQELIRTTCQLAWSKDVGQVRAVVSVHDPYRPHLTRLGFIDRWGYALSAKWLHPQRYLDQTATPTLDAGVGGIELQSAGELPLTLRGPGKGTTRIDLDPPTRTRLLLQRVEIPTAVQEGALTVALGNPSDITMAFPWTPWAFHMLDYI